MALFVHKRKGLTIKLIVMSVNKRIHNVSVFPIHNYNLHLLFCYTLILEREPKIPKTLSSHTIIKITTTIFSMLLILLSMGIYLLMRYKITPETIKTIRIVKTGM